MYAEQHTELTLAALPRRDLLLDWRPEDPAAAARELDRSLRVNGTAATRHGARLEGDHLAIPRALLVGGANTITLQWRASIQPSGSPLTRYLDPDDGREYVYTLFVPAEASSIFPCVDQPDVKAQFSLTLDIADDWRAVANAPIASIHRKNRRQWVRFAPTEPISTYLFAFVAGPFAITRASDTRIATRLWLRRSQIGRARRQRNEILTLNDHAMQYLAGYFAHPFPFAKYDLVLLPEFPYRGMEHAGATFLNERAALLAAGAGEHDRLQRAQLIFHETAHQWLGNLVTMRSFDDLWIKEGFANFLAHKLAARYLSRPLAEVGFNVLKTSAYETDQGPGARPLHRILPDALAARSSYDDIIYGKAPAVLRQCEALLGAAAFRAGARRLVRGHAYAHTDWQALIDALQASAGEDLQRWARAWILRSGVPSVEVTAHGGERSELLRITIRQRAHRSRIWPLRLMTVLASPGAARHRHAVQIDAAAVVIDVPERSRIDFMAGINADDDAYVLVRIPSADLERLAARLPRERRALTRMRTWQMLWQAVRDGKLAPARFVEHVVQGLAGESNELIVRSVLERTRMALDRLLDATQHAALEESLEAMLCDGVQTASAPALARAWLEGFIALVRTAAGRDRLRAVATVTRRWGSLAITSQDRLHAAAAAIIQGVPLDARLALANCPTEAARRQWRLFLSAASPNPRMKRVVFDRYLGDRSLAEAVVIASLDYFNHPAHAAVTLPHFEAALRSLPSLARTRKIFFVNRWLKSFFGGQYSAEALVRARTVLEDAGLDADIAAKAREAHSELRRVVSLRRAGSVKR